MEHSDIKAIAEGPQGTKIGIAYANMRAIATAAIARATGAQ